jgi:aldose 1-epimerase
MTERLNIKTEEALVEVLPRLGAALAAYDVKAGSAWLPILRRWTGESESPRTFASILLAPWNNRISGGGFRFGGKFHPLRRNDPEDPYPLHGDAWFSPWEVMEHQDAAIRLRLQSRAVPPFDYEANVVYALQDATLSCELSVTHRGSESLPYGIGLHPWFVRTPATRLLAPASGVWIEQPPTIPRNADPEPLPEEWDFNTPRHLPENFIDNGFAGWNGRAEIDWPDRGLSVNIAAGPGISYYHIYSLNADCPFFCFEPVTHPVDALNLPGDPTEKGVRVLAPGESTSLRSRFQVKLR